MLAVCAPVLLLLAVVAGVVIRKGGEELRMLLPLHFALAGLGILLAVGVALLAFLGG